MSNERKKRSKTSIPRGVPPKCKRIVRAYEQMGYILVRPEHPNLLKMLGKSPGVNPIIYILAYTSEGKVHPLAGISLLNRSKQ